MLNSMSRRRVIAAGLLITLAFLVMARQLYNVQIVHGDFYSVLSNQMVVEEVPLEQFPRGEITDRNGISLTGGDVANRVVVFPALTSDIIGTIEFLAGVFNIRYKSLYEKANNGPFIIPTPPRPDQQAAILEKDLPGVYLLPVKYRYGTDLLAVHVTGHLGKIESMEELERLRAESNKQYNLDDWVGKSGLELFYEKELKGQQPLALAYLNKDARGRIINGTGLNIDNAGSDPRRYNVMTTIDYDVQRVVEKVMDDYVPAGSIVVIGAGSGDILAMASRPDYHPSPDKLGNYLNNSPGEVFIDRSTSLFQPGSIFKIVLAAAALESGIDVDRVKFACDGDRAEPVKCWFKEGHGELDLAEALSNSCNPAFVQLGEKLGAETIIKYAYALGLGDQTITGYPVGNNARQNLSLIGKDFNLANSSIGQGPVMVTPVQVTAMMNTLASGGIYHQPRLVKALTGPDQQVVRNIDGPAPRRVINSATAEHLKSMLVQVTTSGVGRQANISTWETAGKTGSAELPGEEKLVNAWFAGYVPAGNPRYVITVLVQGGESGGDTAAPVFKEVAERLLCLGDKDTGKANY